MDNGVKSEFPAPRNPGGMLPHHGAGIHAPDSLRRQDCLHFPVYFAAFEVPDLDGQVAAPVPEQVDGNPGICEISLVAANDNSAASVGVGIARDGLDESLAGRSGISNCKWPEVRFGFHSDGLNVFSLSTIITHGSAL